MRLYCRVNLLRSECHVFELAGIKEFLAGSKGRVAEWRHGDTLLPERLLVRTLWFGLSFGGDPLVRCLRMPGTGAERFLACEADV